MGGLMPIFIVRLDDGSCLIGEAESASEAQGEFLERWSPYHEGEELILSVRQLPNRAFLSRWWPLTHSHPDDLPLGSLEGSIQDVSDVYQHEYPAIFEAHEMAAKKLRDASSDTPVVEVISDWDRSLRESLEKAAGTEMRRGALASKREN